MSTEQVYKRLQSFSPTFTAHLSLCCLFSLEPDFGYSPGLDGLNVLALGRVLAFAHKCVFGSNAHRL